MAALPEGTARFLIVMKEQAGLSAACEIGDWAARGQYVYNTLKATAERAQADLRKSLAGQGIDYRPVLVNNGLWVEGGAALVEGLLARDGVANRLLAIQPVAAGPVTPGASTNPLDSLESFLGIQTKTFTS